jgi:signal transduction histidine kinase
VRLTRHDEDIEMVVRDDGQGFEPNEPGEALRTGHIGLASIAERATAVGGDVNVETQPGTGTTVTIRLPLVAIQRATAGVHEPVIPTTRDA